MKQFLALLLLLPMMASAQLAPIYRQFFTTNTAPVVDVVAGSNATVVASTPNASTRRFTVSSTATGGTGQTNWPLSSLTNVPPGNGWTLISSNNVPVWSLNGGALTNVPFSIFTNYTAAPANFTNVSGLAFGAGMYGMTSYWDYATVAGVGPIAIWYNGIDTNTVITTNGGAFAGEILDNSPTKLSPSSNQLVTAYWVRSLFNQGAAYYASTNIATGTNASQANQVLYQFQSTIPLPFARSYSTADFLTNTGYIGSVVTTNTFQSLGGAITISAYLGFTGGNPTPTLTMHPEIYYSYDKTNWYGDYSSQNQNITWNTTNLYQWTVDFPYYSSTNAAGFYVQRRFKVGTTTGTGGARSLHFLGGTNAISGPSDASHITMQSPTATAGNAYLAANQTFSGINTFSQPIVGSGSSLTNIRATNIVGASFYPFDLNANATGTNIYISPTNGPLQFYEFTNTAYATVLSWDTNATETIRLELRGSNTLTWATATLSNSASLGPSNAISVIMLDKASKTNLWWGYRIR